MFKRSGLAACIAIGVSTLASPAVAQSVQAPKAETVQETLARLQAEVAVLRAQNEALRAENAELKSRIEALESGDDEADSNARGVVPPMQVLQVRLHEPRKPNAARIQQINTEVASLKDRVQKNEAHIVRLKSCQHPVRCSPKTDRFDKCEFERRRQRTQLGEDNSELRQEAKKLEGEKKAMEREANEPRHTVRATDGEVTHVLHTQTDCSAALSKALPGMWITWKGEVVDSSNEHERVWHVTRIYLLKEPPAGASPDPLEPAPSGD